MSQSLGQMIQMLSVLGEMQDRRRQLALDERKMTQQAEQFATTAGITKDDQRFNRIKTILSTVAEGGARAAGAVDDLSAMLGFTPEEAQRFQKLAPNATAGLQALQGEEARMRTEQGRFNLGNQQQGLASMTPDQRLSVQQEAALTSQTGQNTGQYQTGQMIGQMAQNAQGQMAGNPNMADRLGAAYSQRTAAGQTPDQYTKGQAFIDRGMAPAAASIEAGITPSAGQMLGFDANMAQIGAAGAGRQGNISDSIGGLQTLHQIAKDLADKKYADKNTANTFLKQYNAVARLLSSQGIQVPPLVSENDAPNAVGRIEMWMRAPFGINAPVSGSLPGAGGGKGSGPPPQPNFNPPGGMRY